MNKKRLAVLVFVFFVMGGWCLEAAAQIFIQTLASDPADSSTAIRSKGRKGIRVLMGPSTSFPIDASGATVSLDLSGSVTPCTPGPSLLACTLNVITPSPNNCGFIATRFDSTVLHPTTDTVEIFYNGDFPKSSSVAACVANVTGTGGTTQGTPGSVKFTTDAGGVRTTASMELVLDISGSMGLPLAADTNPGAKQRIKALIDAADRMYTFLGLHAAVGDKVGQLFFSTDVTAGGGILEPANDPAQRSALQGQVDVQVPTNSTAIGKGLQSAQAGLSGDSNSKKFIFLFSDGEQNTPPEVNFPIPPAGPISLTDGSSIPATTIVCTITMGTQTAPGYALQDQMSTAGQCPHTHSLFVNDGDTTFAQADLDTYFAQELITALGGDKLEIVRDVIVNLTAGAATEKFLANSRDMAMSILVSWEGGRQFRPQFTLIAPNGTNVDLTGRVMLRPSAAAIHLPFPLKQGGATIDPKGQWQLDIKFGEDATTEGSPANYHLMVINDNAGIDTNSEISLQDPGTGEPIPIKVTVKDGGAPVTGATVSAILLGPDNGLGDVLAKALNPSGTPDPNGDLVGSAANGKLLLLLKDPAFLALLKNHSLPLVVLSDPGNTGTYTGTFTNALKEGHYQFVINIHGTSAANGDFDRTRKLTVFVRPKPDPNNTGLTLVSSAVQPDGGLLVQLRVTPKDRFGSFLGPDYLPQLNISCTPCTVSTPIADDLRGSYDVTYKVPANTNPSIGLVVLGQNVTNTSLNDLKNPGGKWAVSFHLGGTIPHANLPGLSGSISMGADLEYRLNQLLSLETFFGYDRFSGGPAPWFVHLSERLKATFGTGHLRPFIFAGAGGYFGGSFFGNHGGINTGTGLQYWFKPKIAAEFTYTFHTVFISGGNPTYSTLQAGVRYVFK